MTLNHRPASIAIATAAAIGAAVLLIAPPVSAAAPAPLPDTGHSQSRPNAGGFGGMVPGTSPSIIGTPGNPGYEIAFQANTGTLWFTEGSHPATNTGLRMSGPSSPSITPVQLTF